MQRELAISQISYVGKTCFLLAKHFQLGQICEIWPPNRATGNPALASSMKHDCIKLAGRKFMPSNDYAMSENMLIHHK